MKILKTSLILVLFIFSSAVSVAYANKKTQQNGMKVFSVQAGEVNCVQHNTDVCIVNYSNQTIFFNVPTLEQDGTINPPSWADVYSNDYYSQVMVNIENSYDQPIFNQPVNNHSIIKVTSRAKTLMGKKLKVTIN